MTAFQHIPMMTPRPFSAHNALLKIVLRPFDKIEYQRANDTYYLNTFNERIHINQSAADILSACRLASSFEELVMHIQALHPQSDIYSELAEFVRDAVHAGWLHCYE